MALHQGLRDLEAGLREERLHEGVLHLPVRRTLVEDEQARPHALPEVGQALEVAQVLGELVVRRGYHLLLEALQDRGVTEGLARELGGRVVRRVGQGDFLAFPRGHPLQGLVHPLVIPRAADFHQGVLVPAGLAPLRGPPGEVENGEVALAGGSPLDGIEPCVLIAQAVDLGVHVLTLHLGDAALRLEAPILGQLHDGEGLEDGPERHGLALVDLEVGHPGHAQGAQAAPLQLPEHDPVDDGLGHVAHELVAEALLHHRGRDPAGAEAGELELPREVPGAGLDFLVHDLRLDLEGEGLPDRCLLDVFDLQGVGFPFFIMVAPGDRPGRGRDP